MRREIKFRGKSLDTGKWEYGYLVMNPAKDLANIANKKGHNEMQMNGVEPETVGQFTGLLDKNGKEIWEGDLLQNGFKEVFVVKWKNGRWIDSTSIEENDGTEADLLGGKYKTVIGNIYESHDLLR